jgi:hypothetical protein
MNTHTGIGDRKEVTTVTTDTITCDYMDEAPGHYAEAHEPHDARPQFGARVDYEDGDIVRHGYACVTCWHTTDESGRFHTDQRLDRTEWRASLRELMRSEPGRPAWKRNRDRRSDDR